MTEAADFTFSISEEGFNEFLQPIKKALNKHLKTSGSAKWHGLTASYDIACHLEGGEVDFQESSDAAPNGDFFLRELHAVWDKLDFGVGLDIPTFKIGGFCIIPNIIGHGCAVHAPGIAFFDKDIDIGLVLPLGGIGLVSEVSLIADMRVKSVGSGANQKWGVFAHLIAVNVLPISMPDTVTNIAKKAIDDVIAALFPSLPDWAEDFISSITNWITDKVRDLLDIPDDLNLWVMDLINNSVNVSDILITLIGNLVLKSEPILKVPVEFKLRNSEKRLITKFAGYGPDSDVDAPPPPLPDPKDEGKIILSAVTIPVQQPSYRFTDERFTLEVNLNI